KVTACRKRGRRKGTASRREHLVGALDGLRLRLVVRLHFVAQVGDPLRVVLQPGRLVGRADLVRARLRRDSEDCVRIEDALDIARGAGPLTPLSGFFLAPPTLVLVLPPRVLCSLTRLLLLAQACLLVLKGLAALVLVVLALSSLFLFLRPLLIRAL